MNNLVWNVYCIQTSLNFKDIEIKNFLIAISTMFFSIVLKLLQRASVVVYLILLCTNKTITKSKSVNHKLKVSNKA